jgi:hypothetical protein
MYDGLTAWDLSSADKASVVIPGLATEWAVDPNDSIVVQLEIEVAKREKRQQ